MATLAERRPKERGIALVLVLIVLPLVAIIMTQLDWEVTIGEHLANNLLANQQFKYAILARSKQMRQRLVRDLKDDEANAAQQGAYDHYSDIWGPDTEGGGTLLVVRRGERLQGEFGGEDSDGDEIALYTQVWDEQGKFNLNLLRHTDAKRRARAFEIFVNLLNFYRDARFNDLVDNQYDLGDGEAREVAEAALKFLRGEERDERVRQTDLPAPSADTKQGVFSVRELVFSHRLFREKRLFERFTDLESNQIVPSLSDFITIYGDGRINANTAPVQVIRAVFKEEEGQSVVADGIYQNRGGYLNTDQDQERRDEEEERRREEEERGITEDDEAGLENGYTNLNDLTQNNDRMRDASFLRRNDIDVGQLFTVRSNFFTVLVTAVRGNFVRQQRLVLERHTEGCVTWATEVRSADLTAIPDEALEQLENREE